MSPASLVSWLTFVGILDLVAYVFDAAEVVRSTSNNDINTIFGAVINENFDAIDELLTQSVYAATAPDSSAVKGKLSAVLGWLANRIKAITGQNSWQASPPVSLTECSNHISNGTHQNATINSNGFMSYSDKQKLDNATSDYTASKLMMRDSSGRARVQSPSNSYDIANKTYVDSNFVKNNADTTMTAKLTAYSNTSYTTKQERIAIIKEWIPDDDGVASREDMDLWDIYADYINGKREIAEINASMTGVFYTEEDLRK